MRIIQAHQASKAHTLSKHILVGFSRLPSDDCDLEPNILTRCKSYAQA